MKINSGQISHNANIGTAKNKSAEGKANSSQENTSADIAASTKVNFSEQAQRINKIKELATPDVDSVREDKVAELQKMIDSGQYSVDAASIADRLVDDHLALS